MFRKVIAVDYDGTITKENAFPRVGEVKDGAIETLLEMQERYSIALWTCRSGRTLKQALDYLKSLGFVPDYVNGQPFTTGSPKMVAHAYIDDAAFPYIAAEPDFWIKYEEELMNL